MVMNLFLIFEPSSNMFSLNWLGYFFPMIFFMGKYFIQFSRLNLIKSMIMIFVISDLKNNLKSMKMKSLLMFLSIFYMVYMLNMLSILPFFFAVTSHLTFSLFFSVFFWVSLMFQGWLNQPVKMFIHLVPKGTPLLLCPFMVLIETISNMIRPLTLAVRLTANMIAGHILLALLSAVLDNFFGIFLSSSIILILLIILEISVALIQGYVFVVLMSLYISELD